VSRRCVGTPDDAGTGFGTIGVIPSSVRWFGPLLRMYRRVPPWLRTTIKSSISVWLAIVIIVEIGLNMAVFPTPAHLVSWLGLCRSAAQSGTGNSKGKPKKGNSYARGAAGQAAIGAARTATFLDERYRRIARRRGNAIAQAAVARSIMIIVWHLLNDPQARYRDLGPDWHARRINRDKKIRTHLQSLKALGVTVAITDNEQAA
jgi:transposase